VQNQIRKIAVQSTRSFARIGAKAIPKGLRKRLEDRFFYAIFNLTRVTNDHYPQNRTQSEKEE
jgi:hypothetical protein